MLFPYVSEHFQIVVCVDATYLAPDGDLEALLADDLTLGRLLELLPHSVAVLFGVSQVTEADAHLGGCSVVSRGLHFFKAHYLQVLEIKDSWVCLLILQLPLTIRQFC